MQNTKKVFNTIIDQMVGYYHRLCEYYQTTVGDHMGHLLLNIQIVCTFTSIQKCPTVPQLDLKCCNLFPPKKSGKEAKIFAVVPTSLP